MAFTMQNMRLLFDSFYSGKLTEGMPFRSIYFLGNIGTSHLYSLLYQLNPNVEWISWILYSYLFVSCFIGLYIVISCSSAAYSFWIKIAAQVVVYLLVFADHNMHFIYHQSLLHGYRHFTPSIALLFSTSRKH
jgi:hypothetical protein